MTDSRSITSQTITIGGDAPYRKEFGRGKRLVHTTDDGREVWADAEQLHVLRPGGDPRERDPIFGGVTRRAIRGFDAERAREDAEDLLALADAYPSVVTPFSLAEGLLTTVGPRLRGGRDDKVVELLAELIRTGRVAIPETAKG